MAIALPAYVTGEIAFVGVKLPPYATGEIASVGVKLPPYGSGELTRYGVTLPPYYSAESGPTVLTVTPAGGMLVGGSANIMGDPVIPTGGMLVSGAAPVTFTIVQIFEMIGRGGVLVGGSAPSSFNWTNFSPSGGMKVGGSAVVVFGSVLMATSGGMKIGGGAPEAFFNVYDLSIERVPSGGMRVAGAAVVSEAIAFVPSGGMLAAGSAIVLEVIPVKPTGGMLVGGSADVQLVSVVTPSGGALIGGAAPVVSVFVERPKGGVLIGGSAVVLDFQAVFFPTGGMAVGGTALAYSVPAGIVLTPENPYNNDFPGWAMNLETNAPSRYARLAANSMTPFMGKTFVTNAGGLYILDAADDAGQPIRAAVELAQTDYGSENDKRIPDVFIAIRTTGKMRLAVQTNLSRRLHYAITRDDGVMTSNRVKLGQGLRGRYWTFGITNVNGADFEFEAMSFTPAMLKRHGR
jgi:hypothetical protein